MTRTFTRGRRRGNFILGAVGTILVLVLAIPAVAQADGFDAPRGDQSLLVRTGTSYVAVGAVAPAGPTSTWVATTFTLGLPAQAIVGGVSYPLVENSTYRLRAWAELGPAFFFGGTFAVALAADAGARGIFSKRPLLWSAGLALDSAHELAPNPGSRYRPVGRLGIGYEAGPAGLFPDAIWLRGSLGYDLRPGRLGAVDADVWLSLRWSFDSDDET